MSENSLQNFIEQVSGEDHSRVQDDLGNGFVRLRAAEAQRRQAKQDIRSFEDVVIEMLRNARDAHATAIFVATWASKEQRFLTMIDDGDGIPMGLQDTIFEPFVTSKLDTFHSDRWGVHGRGMALYSIRQNTDSSRVVASLPGLGSIFSVVSSFSRLKEKRDQSSAPTVSKGSDGAPVLRGPHNILRTVLEFAIDERNSIAVYLGSAAEIVSTLYWLGQKAADHAVCGSDLPVDKYPFFQRFGLCEDASSLADLACGMQLPISSRTAYRIMNGEIAPLPTHLQNMLGKPEKEPEKKKTELAAPLENRRIHFTKEDISSFSQAVASAYSPLADAYYLDGKVEPRIHCSGDELLIRIPLMRSS